MLGSIIPETALVLEGLIEVNVTTAGGYHYSYWHQCLGLLLRNLATMLGAIITETGTDDGGYDCVNWF